MSATSTNRVSININACALKYLAIIPHLLGAHALTGSDTRSYVFGIGKSTVLKILLSGKELDD